MAARAVQKDRANNEYIDALLYRDENGGGWHWSGTITYFLDDYHSAWTDAEKAAFRAALQSWTNVANINCQEIFERKGRKFH